jgi:hypothetical protein
MTDFVTLTCPTCGSKLKVTKQIHLLACAHCGNEHMVVRDSGTLYLAPLAKDVRQIRVGVDKTAAELAVVRLAKEIEVLETQIRNVEALTADSIVPPDFWEKFFGLASGTAFVLSALAFLVGQYGFSWAVAGFLVIVAIGYIVFSETRRHRAGRAKATRLGLLNAELITKRERYRKNHAIADS